MTEAKHTEKVIDSAPAHVFPDDLERLQSSECTATVYSVPMGDPDRGETVPLFSADSHYALVEALGQVTACLEDMMTGNGGWAWEEVLDEARTTLKQSKGES